ncbi:MULTISPECIES: opacity family porin [Eikenella]|uniref:Autotransporter outer membrane beta-barrel domain-containing protein n=1 Tax=Eikenella longinqua TaxID=1795827 RepID=A0A1A9RYG3_9NEIS|nr:MULTISPECIES: opacity family porin [Eikenella]OAM28416.1 autotransporter outer membrane beta-barrel domain-containing protein [Eikenella longinqua]
MKKVLATLLVLSLPAVALADDNRGFYVQADLGHARVKLHDSEEALSAKGFSPRLSVGYDFGDFRVAADYTHYKSESGHETYPVGGEDWEYKFRSFGVSAIYDIDLNAPVKPYVGARIDVNHLSFDDHDYAPGYDDNYHFSKTKTGVGALLGVGYNITQNITLDAGYRYNYWGKFDGTKLDSHEVSAGLRVRF